LEFDAFFGDIHRDLGRLPAPGRVDALAYRAERYSTGPLELFYPPGLFHRRSWPVASAEVHGRRDQSDDVFRHGNFVKYLRYFLYGPDLPETVIESFQRKVIRCGKPFTSSDANEIADFARGLTRSHGLDTYKAPGEFYKLALDCQLDTEDAGVIRQSVMQVR